MTAGKKFALFLLILVLMAGTLGLVALADSQHIPSSGVVTIPDQPVPITDSETTPPTGDSSGPLTAVLFIFACMSLFGFIAVRNREK